MQRWILKARLQRLIACLPRSHWWNGLFQRYVTRGLDLTAPRFQGKIECCRRHWEFYRAHGPNAAEGFTVLELGTGWFPILPIGLYLCGANEIRTYDIAPLLRRDTLREVLRHFLALGQTGALAQSLPGVRPDRYEHFQRTCTAVETDSPSEFLRRLNIITVVADVRHTALPPQSVDFVFSNFALEHIAPEIIAGMFLEFRRVLSPNGIMSHYIGLADQYASFDPGITEFNFLRFTAAEWRRFNNPMIPLTRLRIADYRRLIRDTGFDLVAEHDVQGALDDLRRIPLAPEFAGYTEADLLVTYAWLVARATQSPTSATSPPPSANT